MQARRQKQKSNLLLIAPPPSPPVCTSLALSCLPVVAPEDEELVLVDRRHVQGPRAGRARGAVFRARHRGPPYKGVKLLRDGGSETEQLG